MAVGSLTPSGSRRWIVRRGCRGGRRRVGVVGRLVGSGWRRPFAGFGLGRVAVGPVLPGVERSDAHPVFADGGCHGVEAVDCVAGPELLVCVALVGDCPGVSFDGGSGSAAGAGEVVLGSFELSLSDGEVVAGGASLTAWRCRRGDVGRRWPRRASSARASAARRASRSSPVAAATSAERRVGGRHGSGCLGSPRAARAAFASAARRSCWASASTVGNHSGTSQRLSGSGAARGCGLGEGAALGGGGDVGAVDGEDGFEDVAGLGDVVAVGDDAQSVGVAAAGGGDVQAAAGGGRGDEGDGGVDGVGLPAVLGRCVAEPDVLRT